MITPTENNSHLPEEAGSCVEDTQEAIVPKLAFAVSFNFARWPPQQSTRYMVIPLSSFG